MAFAHDILQSEVATFQDGASPCEQQNAQRQNLAEKNYNGWEPPFMPYATEITVVKDSQDKQDSLHPPLLPGFANSISPKP